MSAATGADPVRRTFEIEDPTNLYFIHPISAYLVPIFARAGITPNQVSLLGMAAGILAGLSYHFYHLPACAILGFLLMLVWHVMDGADGQLARLTQSYSELGKVLDGICDYVTFAAVYIGLWLAMPGHGVWVLVAVSGICHAMQSATYELQRQNYNFLGHGRESAALPSLAPLPPGLGFRARIAAELNRVYTRVQLLASGGAAEFNAAFLSLAATRPELREKYREWAAPMIRRWGILCANYRTLGIFIAALLNFPALYFLFEIFGFSAILVLLLRAQQARNAEFLRQAQALAPLQTP